MRRQKQGDPIVVLADAAAAPNVPQFAALCASIDWKHRSSSEIVHAIRLALKAGARIGARQLATEGAIYHLDDKELQKYARILHLQKYYEPIPRPIPQSKPILHGLSNVALTTMGVG